jgi:hypothetical protein
MVVMREEVVRRTMQYMMKKNNAVHDDAVPDD